MDYNNKRGTDINTITFTGRLVAEPEIKQLNNEKQTLVACFAVANQTYMAKNTSFLRCQAYGPIANYIGDYLHKGSSVVVHGELTINNYTDKDGVHRSFTNINVSNIVSASSANSGNVQDTPELAMNEEEFYKEYDEGELPF